VPNKIEKVFAAGPGLDPALHAGAGKDDRLARPAKARDLPALGRLTGRGSNRIGTSATSRAAD